MRKHRPFFCFRWSGGAVFVLPLREIYKSGRSLFFSGSVRVRDLINLVDFYKVSLAALAMDI